MSISVTTRVWERSTQSGSHLLALLAIADHADDYGVAWPGIPRIAHKARVKERQAQRIIQSLAEAGELYIQIGGGRGNSNLYLVTVGLTEDEIKKAFMVRFEMTPIEALALARSIVKQAKKGVLDDTVSEGSEEKTVSSGAEKGVMQDRVSAERVSCRTIKGVIAMTPEPLETVMESPRTVNGTDSDSFLSLLWASALAEIKLQTTKATFKAWFIHTQPLRLEGHTLVIGVQDGYACDWLGKRMNGAILRVVASLDPRIEQIEYEVPP